MAGRFPWYDSLWLTSFVRAKIYVRDHYPDRLEEFVRAFDILRTDADFETRHLRGMISAQDHSRLKELVVSERAIAREKHELLQFGRLIVHDAPICVELQAKLATRVSELVNEEVEPCYNFLSLYNNLGVCAVHLDAPSAKWTFDYCIEQSAAWPIYISQVGPWPEDARFDDGDWDRAIRDDPANHFVPHTLQEGEAIIFGGSSQWHYRDRIARTTSNNYCHLVFFHYVPKGARQLTNPTDWAEHFRMDGLAGVILPPKPVDSAQIG